MIMKLTQTQQNLGKIIQEIRLEQGLSQEDLSEKSGLHRTYIGSIERGERNISLKNLLVIAKALNIRLSDLLKKIDL